MNERIKELAAKSNFGHMENDNVVYDYRLEKFAELIVKECIAICQDIDGEDNIDAKSGRQDCAVEIQEYFGVEE